MLDDDGEMQEILLDALLDDSAAGAWRSFLDYIWGAVEKFALPEGPGAAIESLAASLFLDSIPPSFKWSAAAVRAFPGGAREANGQRERSMCDEILALCRGGKQPPRKRIMAVVGKAHVLPLRMLLGGG